MKAISKRRLTAAYLKKNRLYNAIAVTAVGLIIAVSLFWMIFASREASSVNRSALFIDNVSVIFYSIVYSISAIIGIFWTLQTAYRMHRGPVQLDRRYQRAWLYVGVGLLATCLGALWYVVRLSIGPLFNLYAIVMHGAALALPSFADPIVVLLSVLFYVFTFIGLILMPGLPRLSVSMIFDVLITVLCFMGICWFFVATPATIAAVNVQHVVALGYPAAGLIATALFYPGADILLLLVLALLLQQGVEQRMRTSLLLLGAGFLANIWADVARAYMVIASGGYHVGVALIDPFWFACYLLLGLAALYQYSALVHGAYDKQVRQSATQSQQPIQLEGIAFKQECLPMKGWQSIQNIYIPLALLLYAVVFIQAFNHMTRLVYADQIIGLMGLVVLSAILGALIAIRHFFAAHENKVLLQEQEQRYRESEHVRFLVEQLTDIRDLENLRECIVNAVLREFGFTMAMLILVEEHDSALSERSHLLISTCSRLTPATKWRLRADNLFFHVVSLGKKNEVEWKRHSMHIPPEVHVWCEKQQVATMVFFPVSYQGKKLGSLGVAQHALTHFSSSEGTMLSMYADQISAMIEHAHLYQKAREREKLARSMAMIATRLNAAVVEPAEISQLICSEGKKALRADYTIFYIKHDDDQLEAMTSAISELGHPIKPTDWPSFYLSEYVEDPAHWTQPMLIDVTQRRKQQVPVSAVAESGTTMPLLLSNREYQGQRAQSLQAKLARHYIQTAILAPLVAGGHIIGVLIFGRSVTSGTSSEHIFDISDLPHAQGFVEQAGVTFANAQLYQHLRTAHERLKELDQLKDQFMITASHELRTPLTAVQGYIELIAQYDEALPVEQRREFLQKAQLGCEELSVLLRNVMDASRLEAEAGIKPALISRVSVKRMIEKVQLMIEPQVTHGQREVQVSVPPHLVVYADPVRLHQVLMNVSNNALKYSPVGTPISFSARVFIDQGRFIIISIADKGKGILPQDQANLFQRFFRLEADMNSPIRGSGLGLYISRRLIDAMGGKIWIESSGVAGEGSIFHIQLPMAS